MPPPSSLGRRGDIKLLHLVKEHPEIYDRNHDNRYPSDKREVAWQMISEQMQISTAEFAGIQCQVQFGDYNEEKHKPGFLEVLREYLPEQYCGSWGMEKKVLKEYSKHAGLSELEAKHLYTKIARALPTYGVTFFLVKEKQKGKQKLVPRLLGINAESILRLDETSKEIIQTWPLTHVKTYHAGRGETFTLNFGDYSDKEYTVKTRDAFRIRDILEGYIDLIRKRMLGNYNVASSDHGYVGQDNISCGQASLMQHVANSPGKVVEHSVVGPSKIIEYAPGQRASSVGTQVVTAQQLVIAEMKNKQEKGVLKADVTMREDMGVPFTRRLNRLNSNSVKIVNLLTDPSQAQLEDAHKIAADMNADMPTIRDGVAKTIAKQSSEEERRKLQNQMNQLDELMRSLVQHSNPHTANPAEAEDAAKQIASLSTEMYFAIAPEPRRRSSILKSNRRSIRENELAESGLRRPSFIAATATANHALDSAAELVEDKYKGPTLSDKELEELELSALDKLGKINAAIAHYQLAHSDPKNIDYSSGVNSLNTLHELVPDLARDGQILASALDGAARTALVNDIKELCAAAKHLCSLSGVEDQQKLQEATLKYADVSGRLVYVFGKRGGKARADKENQIIELTEIVVEKTSALLSGAQALAREAGAASAARHVEAAAGGAALAANSLQAHTTLNAPTISEPHCRTALTAASEALFSSAQLLVAACKPLVEHPSRHLQGEKLHHQSMELARVLDALREAYAGDTQGCGTGSSKPGMDNEAHRLKFINTVSKLGGKLRMFEQDLEKPLASSVSEVEAEAAQHRLSERVAHLNAAMATMLAAISDRDNPDHKTAEAAAALITDSMPDIVKDSKLASANQDAASRGECLAAIKELCAAVCTGTNGLEPEALSESLMKFTDASNRLTYAYNRRANPHRETQIVEATSAACAQAGALLASVQRLEVSARGAGADLLDSRGAALADAAGALLTTAQVTAPTISEPRCQSTLLNAVDRVVSSTDSLQQAWRDLPQDKQHTATVQGLDRERRKLDDMLEEVRVLCQVPDDDIQSSERREVGSIAGGAREQEKLRFVTTMRGANEKLEDARKELNKPAMPAKGANMDAVQRRLDEELEQLNTAMAALLLATADRENPDCAAAQRATETITKLMPQLIRDTKTLSSSKDECARAAMLSEIQALCDASARVCASAYGDDTQDRNDAVSKFAEASGKLVFVVNPRNRPQKTKEVTDLARSACKETSALLPDVQKLSVAVGGSRGRELDTQGGRLASAAQALLQATQILGPSLQSPQCQEALLSSISSLSDAGKQLESTVAPLKNDPKHAIKAKEALLGLQRLEKALEELKAVCKAPGTQDTDMQQKLQFIKTLEDTKGKWADVEKELKKPVPPSRGSDTSATEKRLCSRLAALHAAIATLLTSTPDNDKPSYAEAEKSVRTISELLPQIVHDSKTLSSSKDECARAAMLSEIQALCDASARVCASAYGDDTQDRNEAVSKFAEASGKLVFVVNPRNRPQRTKEVTDLARSACKETSALLPDVQELSEAVGGSRGRELDAQGGRLASAAQALLQATQILGPSLQSSQCQEALLSYISSLSDAGKQLESTVAPLKNDPKHGVKAKEALLGLQRLEKALEELKAACKASGTQDTEMQQKLQFIKTLEDTKGKWADVEKELKKPVPPSRGTDTSATEERLCSRLAALHAAIATLLMTTPDKDKPSYAEAEKSVRTISELLPQIVHDSKTLSSSKDECARAAMLSEIQALCDASARVCASAYGDDTQDRNDAVSKFAEASGKLVFVVNPRNRPQKTKEVTDLARSACKETSALLPDVRKLSEAVGGSRGRELDAQGGRLASAAQALLQATQILGPSLQSPQCQEALLSSISSLSDAGKQLGSTVEPLKNDPKHGVKAKEALLGLQRLEKALEELKAACKAPGTKDTEMQQKLQFIKALEDTKGKWSDIEKELKKPVPPSRGSDTSATEERLCSRLAALHAAIATLLTTTPDKEKPSYAEAEKSVKTISELLPQIVQDSKTVSSSKDECARAAMLSEIQALCDASARVCASAYGDDTQDRNDAVSKFAEASGKLVFVVNPRNRPQRTNEVTDLARSACQEISALLPDVQKLSEAVGGSRGRELDTQGGRLASAAQALLQATQILGPSLQSPQCQEALLSSISSLSDAGKQLESSVAPLKNDPKHGVKAKEALLGLQRLEKALEGLRSACIAPGQSTPTAQSSTAPCVVGLQKVEAPQRFFTTDDEKIHCPMFTQSLENAGKSIKAYESSIMKLCRLPSGAGPALSHREMMEKQAQLQKNLALAGVHVSNLVDANYVRSDDRVDYSAGIQSSKHLPELMSSIVEDGSQLADNLTELARKAFLYDLLRLCEAGRNTCEAGLGDRQKLNDAAVKFGDTSTKLLYVVSNDVDPTLEKEIISRAKEIGEEASRLALDAGNLASAVSGSASVSVQDICDAGTVCVDAAGKLVYTAKLTAPSIHETPCQEALVASADRLVDRLDKFADSWAPLQTDPTQAKSIAKLGSEVATLKEMVSTLRDGVKEGSLRRKKEMEQLVVEDTPIRQLTCKILEEARHHAESAALATKEKIAYASYADKISEALQGLDLANARCKKSPHDTNKRRELENAIQNLQMILLQSRPSRGDKGKTNIVDLMDFMEEVAAEAKNLSSAASSAQVPSPQDMLALEEIKDKCDKIQSKANKLIVGDVASDLNFNDLFDQFGQECEDTIKKLDEDVRRMEDTKAKKQLQSNVMALSESCNMLRFATKSGISTEACCSLDATLDQLDHVEDQLVHTIVREITSTRPSDATGVEQRAKQSTSPTLSPATMKLCQEVTSSPSGVESSTLTAYIADAAARSDGSPEDNNKLLKHLYKLVHLLKTLAVRSSARAATWQPEEGPETARLTANILQEIHNPDSKFGVRAEDNKQKILEDDIVNLLVPSAPKILGDKKQQEDKLTSTASQLSATCSDLTQAVSRDSATDSGRNLSHLSRVAADQATELECIARGVHFTDPVQRRRIDDAAKEMSFATYNLLKTAESVCLESKNSDLKRRLADALQNLNHSIDKLVWHSSCSPALSRACGALARGASAQLGAVRAHPTSHATYTHTCDTLAAQQLHIGKLRSEEAIPRKEFMRQLDDIGTAVHASVACAEHCAYYIAVSDKDKEIAKAGLVDVPHIQKCLESIQDSCMAIIGSTQIDQAKEQKEDLHKRVVDFTTAIDQAQMLVKDGEVKRDLLRARSCVNDAGETLGTGLEKTTDMDQIAANAVELVGAVKSARALVEQCPLVPPVGTLPPDTREKCDDVINHSKSLLQNTLALIKDVQMKAGGLDDDDDDGMMTWVTFNTNRKKLLDAYDALLKTVRRNGQRVGIYEKAPEEEEEEKTKKSYIEVQVDLANKWLKSPACKAETKSMGQQATRNLVDMARQMSEDLKGVEREEVRGVISETEQLLAECSHKYDHEKNSVLMDRIKEIRKWIQRGVVTRVVEDFIEAEEPLLDLDLLPDVEQDEYKRKFILERKIASLLAQLGRVSKTARFVANSSQHQHINLELNKCSEQTELLAPMLVKAAQQRIDHPDDQTVIEKYKALLAQYAESISRVRDLCDRAVDPMDFVQTASETMQRMREDMTQQSSDTQKCAHNSAAITKLANRVITVSMSSPAVSRDPELARSLLEAKQRLTAATPPRGARASRLPHWQDTTAEILRTTGDVESALGGENIFKKEPTTANQPIYNVARSLHESVREWSSRDNEIVGVARRMAVLMARLSEYMETDKKDDLIETSKSIVAESQEVTDLAKKLANECTDVRIKTNLLQTCERIPTISGQLKMLTAVKAASLGQQGVEEDKEAMDMLVGNAQSLMMSVSDVVKAAASASVKIMSQRGPRLRWVRKTYY